MDWTLLSWSALAIGGIAAVTYLVTEFRRRRRGLGMPRWADIGVRWLCLGALVPWLLTAIGILA